MLPTAKNTAGGLTGALSVLVIWIIHSGFKIDVPPEIASAITTILSFIAAYLAPHTEPPMP